MQYWKQNINNWEENKKMNNFVMGLKRFITNKNVVTVIGVLLVLVILFWGYTSSITKTSKTPITVTTFLFVINLFNPITKLFIFLFSSQTLIFCF